MTEPEPESWTTYSLLFDVFVLNQAVAELLESAMAGGPLTPSEYAVYSVVFEAERVTPTAMARRLSIPLTTLASLVREMERRGHVRRVPNASDGRSYLLVLSAEGLRVHREANRRFEIAYRRVLDALPADQAQVRASLRALTGAVRLARVVTSDADAPIG